MRSRATPNRRDVFAARDAFAKRDVITEIWARAEALGVRALAVVGTNKHAGKTTLLGALLQCAPRASLALVSIGVDGERADVILGTPKPQIVCRQGTWVATVITANADSSAAMAWHAPTSITSPLGEVWIGQTRTPGSVVLAGVRQKEQLLALKTQFFARGAAYMLIDGALSRMAAVDSELADGVVLAVGNVRGSLQETVAVAKSALLRLRLSELEPELARQLPDLASVNGLVALPCDRDGETVWGDPLFLPEGSLLTDDFARDGRVTDAHSVFYCGGAVTDAWLARIAARMRPQVVIVRSAAHLFCSDETMRQFARGGHRLRVLRSVPLLGVAVNPMTPRGGQRLERGALMRALKAEVNVPVVDAMEVDAGALYDG